jgi:hypothetical protein
MPATRVLFVLVALLSVGYVGGFVGSILWYVVARLAGPAIPPWVVTFPCFFLLAALFGWLLGRWSEGPSLRDFFVGWALDVPASMLLAYAWGGTTLLQAALWALALGGVLCLAAYPALARRAPARDEYKERMAPQL